MPTNNQTLIAIPPEVTDVAELKQFLVRLIVALDEVIGYRQSETPQEQLVTLERVLELIEASQTDIDPLEPYEQTISALFIQSEIQFLSDAVTRLTNKVNEIVS